MPLNYIAKVVKAVNASVVCMLPQLTEKKPVGSVFVHVVVVICLPCTLVPCTLVGCQNSLGGSVGHALAPPPRMSQLTATLGRAFRWGPSAGDDGSWRIPGAPARVWKRTVWWRGLGWGEQTRLSSPTPALGPRPSLPPDSAPLCSNGVAYSQRSS